MEFIGFDTLYLLALAVHFAVRLIYGRNYKRIPKVDRRTDIEEWALLLAVFAGMFVAPLVHIFSSWLAFADYRLPSLLKGLGAVLFVPALWLFWRSHKDLADNFTPMLEILEGHVLVTTGVYKHVRHPMYASVFLWSVAQGLVLANWVAGPLMLISFSALYWRRLPKEERQLEDGFGDTYREYRKKTGALWPAYSRSDSDM